MRFSLLAVCVQEAPLRRTHHENSMSTSMKRMYLALLASACWLSLGFPQAAANEAGFVTDPLALHADQSAMPPAPAPMRTASADRPNMGGGFIEFLFGGG